MSDETPTMTSPEEAIEPSKPTGQPMPTTPPDAVMLHHSLMPEGTFQVQRLFIQDKAIELLKLSTAEWPPPVQQRNQGEWFFCHPTGHHTINHHEGHRTHAKKPRYTWYQTSPGVVLGWLTDLARQEQEANQSAAPAIPRPPVTLANPPA